MKIIRRNRGYWFKHGEEDEEEASFLHCQRCHPALCPVNLSFTPVICFFVCKFIEIFARLVSIDTFLRYIYLYMILKRWGFYFFHREIIRDGRRYFNWRMICFRTLDTSIDTLVEDFERDQWKPEMGAYSRKLIEVCCSKALTVVCGSIDEKIIDGSFSRFTFDMMIALEIPSSAEEESYTVSFFAIFHRCNNEKNICIKTIWFPSSASLSIWSDTRDS